MTIKSFDSHFYNLLMQCKSLLGEIIEAEDGQDAVEKARYINPTSLLWI